MASKRREAERKFTAKLQDLPTPEEWVEFFRYGFDPDNPVHVRDRALFLLMLMAGLRVGEACALELDSLNLSEGRLDVPDVPGLTKRGARTTYFDRKDASLTRALEAWIDARSSISVRTSRLFTTAQGNLISNTTILRQAIRRAAVRAWNNNGLTPKGHRVHTHALRHSFATQAIHSGAPLNVVQAALGHEKPDMTFRYVKANPQHVRDWFARQSGLTPYTELRSPLVVEIDRQ